MSATGPIIVFVDVKDLVMDLLSKVLSHVSYGAAMTGWRCSTPVCHREDVSGSTLCCSDFPPYKIECGLFCRESVRNLQYLVLIIFLLQKLISD